jgi:hypothetical protein
VPSPDLGPAELLAALARALSSLGVPWYLFGAQAAVIWGRPRLTADVDVTVRLPGDDHGPLVRVLAEAGFTPRTDDLDEFVRRTRVLPFVHGPSQLPVDVVLAGRGLEEAFLSRAVPVTIAGVSIPVISPEDLVVVKILAGRAKDIEDVRGVLAERRASLDVDSVRATLGQIEEALGRSDLLRSFQNELDQDPLPGAASDPASVAVDQDDLELAFDFVSSAGPFDNQAFVSLETGAIYWQTEDEELPDDIDDSDRYVAVPHKNDLDLGRRLALRFAEERLSSRYEEIAEAFRHRGAYGRFKRILESAGCLEDWYTFETAETARALREWCAENGLRLTRRPRPER